MKRYLKLVWNILVITFALYIIRPIEALYQASKWALLEGFYCFKSEWAHVYQKEGWKSLDLYKAAFTLFKDSK